MLPLIQLGFIHPKQDDRTIYSRIPIAIYLSLFQSLVPDAEILICVENRRIVDSSETLAGTSTKGCYAKARLFPSHSARMGSINHRCSCFRSDQFVTASSLVVLLPFLFVPFVPHLFLASR
jgi:hypothetical protein